MLPGDSNFHLFESLPTLLYGADNMPHKQLGDLDQEFLHACYVLVINNEPKARLAVYHNPNLYFNAKKTICIGNYECVANDIISEKLISFSLEVSKSLGANFIVGPMNGSTWNSYRFSKHNDFPNFLLEPFHPVYYNDQFLKAGLIPISNYISSIDRGVAHNPIKMNGLDLKFRGLGVKIRSVVMSDYDNELKKLYPFILKMFQHNFLFTPISWETFSKKYKEAARIINPDYFLIAEDNDENVIGFIFCYDDLFNLEEKSLVIKTIARDPARQWSGLAHLFILKILDLIKSKQYGSVVHAFMNDNAKSTKVSDKISGKVYKNYTLYGMDL